MWCCRYSIYYYHSSVAVCYGYSTTMIGQCYYDAVLLRSYYSLGMDVPGFACISLSAFTSMNSETFLTTIRAHNSEMGLPYSFLIQKAHSFECISCRIWMLEMAPKFLSNFVFQYEFCKNIGWSCSDVHLHSCIPVISNQI